MPRHVRPRLFALAMAVGLIMVLAHIAGWTGPMERATYAAHLTGSDGRPLPLWLIVAITLGLSLTSGWAWQRLAFKRGLAVMAALSGMIVVGDVAAFRIAQT